MTDASTVQRRRRYLAAMGITEWVARHAPARQQADGPPPPLPAAELAVGVSAAAHPAPLAARDTLPEACDWDSLRASVAACTHCGELVANRTQTVFGVGNTAADWMVIGEAPGADEDRRGEPFVGRAGQLLNAMLQAAGSPREQVYIANILKCRPPNNRDPKPEEAQACAGYLSRQIALVRPKLILVVGRIAAQRLLGTDAPIGRLRGRVHRYEGLPLVVTYHPAYLLRSPGEKRKAWDDLKLALSAYREAGS